MQGGFNELFEAKQTMEECAVFQDEHEELRRFRDWAERALTELLAFRKAMEWKFKSIIVRTAPSQMNGTRQSERETTKQSEHNGRANLRVRSIDCKG